MQAIDHYAWTNRWRNRHPVEKLLPALTLLVLTLALPPLTIGPLVLAGTLPAMVYGAGIPLKTVLSVLAAPAAFLLAGVPFLAISVSFNNGFGVRFSPEGLRLAVETMVRALAATSCLTALILTTPLTDLIPLLRRIGVPSGIVELILLIYRLIFVFAERALTGRQAQAARLGYSSVPCGIRSAGWLAGALFQRALERARRLELGLTARGYTGELRVLPSEWALSWSRLALSMILAGLIGLAGSLLAGGPA